MMTSGDSLANALYPSVSDFWGGLLSDADDAEVGVLGIPFDNAVCFRKGAAFAPARIRELSSHLSCSAEEGEPLRLRVRDYGDVRPDLEWERYFQTVEERALEALRHPFALFLGGDHSVPIPLMRAFDRVVDGPFGVVHFDAHADLFDIYDGHRWSHANTERRALELAGLRPENLVFVGLRSIANPEWAFLQDHPEITYHTARQCYKRGIESIAEAVVTQLQGLEAVYFTLDIDGLDPAYAPGTGTPEGGGLSTRELLELARILVEGLPIRAMDIVEVAPPLDHADITSFAALKVIYEVWAVVQGKLNVA